MNRTLPAALEELMRATGISDGRDLSIFFGKMVLASSSAAGGLRITVVGNVPGLIRGED